MKPPGHLIFRRILTQRLLEFGLDRCPKIGRLLHFEMLALAHNVHGKFTHVGERNVQEQAPVILLK